MTTFQPVNDTSSPYHGMALPVDPTSGSPYAVNPFTGVKLPHAAPGLTTHEQRIAALHPQIRENMRLLAQQQSAQSKGRMPSASPLPPGSTPQVSAAAEKAKVAFNPKAQKATTTHSFDLTIQGKEQSIKLTESFTKHDAEGIAVAKKVSPSVWKQVENIYQKQLTDNPKLLPKNIKVKSLGFSKHQNEIRFEVYFMRDGVLERRLSDPISAELTTQINELQTHYSKVLKTASAPCNGRYVSFTPHELSKLNLKTFSLDSPYANPVAVAVHNEAVDRAKVLKQTHSVHYTYPKKSSDYQKLIQEIDPRYDMHSDLGDRDLTQLCTFEVMPHSTKTEDHQARILHKIPLRSGYHKHNLLPTEESQELADTHPLHYCINAHLGRLDKEELAPRTAHHRDVLISLQRRNALFTLFGKMHFVKEEISPVLLQEDFEVPKLAGLDQKVQTQKLFNSIVDQALKYACILHQYKGSLKPTVTIKDAICSEFPISVEEQADVRHSIFVRMVAAMLTNSKPNMQGPKINLVFELPQEIDFDQRGYLHQVAAGMAQAIHEEAQTHIIEDDPMTVMRFIEKFLNPSTETSQEDSSSIDSGSFHSAKSSL
ncbi:MAG: hypothetical protein S4CHLAM6_11730 [Chlamydiae bacterium]|nr:hypothetical protein [Chlamydiota bacterium]